jgi:hypothetical protein
MTSATLRPLCFLAFCFAAILACGSRTGLVVPGAVADAGAVGCSTEVLTLTKADPALMFLIDRSRSMADLFTPSGQSRWQVLTGVLASVLPPVDASMQIGALLFPDASSLDRRTNCSVASTADLLPATGNVSRLVSLLESTPPGGGTPTAQAMDTAAPLLLAVRASVRARAIVLATDGGPNCNPSLDPVTCRCAGAAATCLRQPLQCLDDARTVATVASYRAKGLPTYVIGIQDPGASAFEDVLNAMAQAGGRPLRGGAHAYYAASSGTDLEQALVAIRDQLQCTFLTTSVPDPGGSISIRLGGEVLPFDPSGAQGWQWGEKSNGEIVLAPAACAQAAGTAKASLIAHVTCADGGL